MSEAADHDSKTEEATPRKIEESINKGRVPFSREAPVFVSLVGVLAIAAFLLRDNVARLTLGLEQIVENPAGWSLEHNGDVVRLFEITAGDAAQFLLPLIGILTVAGVVSSAAQNPLQIVFERIKPDLSRISISQGWRRVFGLHGHAEFLKACFKFSAVGVVTFIMLRSEQHKIVNAMLIEARELPDLLLDIGMRLLAAVSVATIVLVAGDLVWSRFSWRRNLRMTRQELKDEHRQSDGDPLVKARQRSLARDRQRKRMMAQVPKSTVVIANPTHYAVALRYVRAENAAPVVLAKGKDLIAPKIREMAEKNGIPVVEDKPLARALCENVEIDTMIPAEFYHAVAQIIYLIHSQKSSYRTAN